MRTNRQQGRKTKIEVYIKIDCAIIFRQMVRRMLKKGESPDLEHTELYDRLTKIETEIIRRIQKLRQSSKNHECVHFKLLRENAEEYDPRVNYYDKFWKRFLLNEIGKQNLQIFKDSLALFEQKLAKIEALMNQRQELIVAFARPKRNKQSKQHLDYECPQCLKCYEDAQKLKIHQRVKHEPKPYEQSENVVAATPQLSKELIFEEDC